MFIGEILCFPYVFAQTFSLQEVHEAVLNELQKETLVSHFPQQKPISKQQRRSVFKNKKSSNQQSIENRQMFNTAGYEPINMVLKLDGFLDFLFEQMIQDEWWAEFLNPNFQLNFCCNKIQKIQAHF